MPPVDDLVPILKKLRLSGVLQSLDIRLRQVTDNDIGAIEFLYRLLQDEVERREAKQLQLRLGRAAFESHKSFDDFDFSFNAELPKAKLLDLATCRFLDTHTNLLLVGPAGVGKSHLAQAIGQRTCLAGHSVLYVTAHQLFATLRASRADATYDRKLARFTSPRLLIIDDLGLRPLADDEPMDLYEIIRQRYERSSTPITSNRDVTEWYPLFGDALLASAAMDRLLHHSHLLVLEGHSFRTAKKAA
jgi:DNA replication protein DnaC